MSDNVKFNWEYELGDKSYESYFFIFYDKWDFMVFFVFGFVCYGMVIICFCFMGLLGCIVIGVLIDFIICVVDVVLKECCCFILVFWDMFYSFIYFNNMKVVMEVGGIICLVSLFFYSCF